MTHLNGGSEAINYTFNCMWCGPLYEDPCRMGKREQDS